MILLKNEEKNIPEIINGLNKKKCIRELKVPFLIKKIIHQINLIKKEREKNSGFSSFLLERQKEKCL